MSAITNLPIVVLFLVCHVPSVSVLKDKPLTIGGIFPMSGSWAGGVSCLPAVEMALEDVNNRTDILPDYRLEMSVGDSECKPGLGTKVLYKLLYEKPTKLLVLTGCSIVSTFVAQAAKMWKLVVLSYGGSSPALSNRERFPTLFRTHPSATLHNPIRVKVFKKFNWNRISTIQEIQELFTSTIDDLEKRVKKAGIDIAVRQSFLTDPLNAVRNLKRQDARIIVGVFYEDMARRVFCQAYKEKLYGKKYVWFIIGWYPDNWYRKKDGRHNCTVEQLEEALEGHFTTEAVILHQEPTMTDVGMTASQFTERLDKMLNVSDTSLMDGYPEAPLAYDAVWALAFAFNKTVTKLAEKGLNLEDFDYDNEEIHDAIYSAMNSTKFLGISGNVAFSSKGERIAWTQIEQFINGSYVKLGVYDTIADNLTWYNKEKWAGGRPPNDHTRVIDHLRVVSHSLYFSMCGLAALGMVAGLLCLVFTYINRHRQCIAFSQPLINSLTVVGCIICLGCIFLLGLDGKFVSEHVFPVVCQVRAWLLSLGFTLSFGSMFSKIWTVHQLTTSRKKDRGVQTWELFTVLGILVFLDVAILSAWQIMDPLQRRLEFFEREQPTDTDDDIELQPQLEHCHSDNLTVWLGVLFGYKGILLIFGIFLAYETRSVKLKQVNDSRFVGMSIYNVVVLCVITAPISLIIGNQEDATFAFVSQAIVLCSFLSMGLIFVPKIKEIIQNPGNDGKETQGVTDSLVSREEEERHQKMLAENEQLKKQIAEMEDRIKDLNQKLQDRDRHHHRSSLGNNKLSHHPFHHHHHQHHHNAHNKLVMVVDPLLDTNINNCRNATANTAATIAANPTTTTNTNTNTNTTKPTTNTNATPPSNNKEIDNDNSGSSSSSSSGSSSGSGSNNVDNDNATFSNTSPQPNQNLNPSPSNAHDANNISSSSSSGLHHRNAWSPSSPPSYQSCVATLCIGNDDDDNDAAVNAGGHNKDGDTVVDGDIINEQLSHKDSNQNSTMNDALSKDCLRDHRDAIMH